MFKYTRCKVLIPNRILIEEARVSKERFLFEVKNYLQHYPNYRFISVENGFAVCDREDEIKGRAKKSGRG